MLDTTIVYFGCSNSVTHVNRNCPLLMAGGRKLGLKQGLFHEMDQPKIPLSNLLLTFLRQLDVPAASFSDSTGIVKEVLT